jgi:hypothetical protein
METKAQKQERVRTGRLNIEWNLLQQKVSPNGPILSVERVDDKFTCIIARTRKNDTVIVVFSEFPCDFPWNPPCWEVKGFGEEFEFDWLRHDPWQGAYGPMYNLPLWIDRLVEMTYKTRLSLKDYEKRH